MQIAYENSFLRRFDGNHTNAKNHIEDTMTHVQNFYNLPSLGYKIIFERIGGIMHFQDEFVKRSDLNLDRVKTFTSQNIQNADLMVYIAGRPEGSKIVLTGLANIGVVCNPYVYDYKSGHNHTANINMQRSGSPTILAGVSTKLINILCISIKPIIFETNLDCGP